MKPVRLMRNKIPREGIVLLVIFMVFFCSMWIFVPEPISRWMFGLCIVLMTLAIAHALVKDNWVELHPKQGTIVSMRTSWYFNRRKTSYQVSEFAFVRTILIYHRRSATYEARIELVTKDRKKALEINTFDAIFEKLPAGSFHLIRRSIENPRAVALRKQVSEILGMPDYGYSEEMQIALLP